MVRSGVYFARLDRQLGNDANAFSNEFSLWKRLVDQGNAVVLINASRAPFADVIALTDGALFLTQSKHLSANSSRCDAKAEFTKMRSDEETAAVFAELVNCCRNTNTSNGSNANSAVRVVCSIFLRSETTTITNKYIPEKFSGDVNVGRGKIKYDGEEKYLYAFPEAELEEGTTVDQSCPLFCSLYPVLQTPLLDSTNQNLQRNESMMYGVYPFLRSSARNNNNNNNNNNNKKNNRGRGHEFGSASSSQNGGRGSGGAGRGGRDCS